MSVMIIIITILILILLLTLAIKSNNKSLKILCITFLIGVVIFISIVLLRFLNPIFRVNYDMLFNNSKENVAYVDGEEYYLPLPKDTVELYRYSDYGVAYCTKLSYDEVINYYYENDYTVENNDVIFDGVKYTLKQDDDYTGKYTTIKIETYLD